MKESGKRERKREREREKVYMLLCIELFVLRKEKERNGRNTRVICVIL